MRACTVCHSAIFNTKEHPFCPRWGNTITTNNNNNSFIDVTEQSNILICYRLALFPRLSQIFRECGRNSAAWLQRLQSWRWILMNTGTLWIALLCTAPPFWTALARLQSLLEFQLTSCVILWSFCIHRLVIDTLKDVDASRKCFRLVGGVLVERTVKEVLPALESNKEQVIIMVNMISAVPMRKTDLREPVLHKEQITYSSCYEKLHIFFTYTFYLWIAITGCFFLLTYFITVALA